MGFNSGLKGLRKAFDIDMDSSYLYSVSTGSVKPPSRLCNNWKQLNYSLHYLWPS